MAKGKKWSNIDPDYVDDYVPSRTEKANMAGVVRTSQSNAGEYAYDPKRQPKFFNEAARAGWFKWLEDIEKQVIREEMLNEIG